MCLLEREPEMKIKGNKKDMEKTEKLFECRRALNCKKTPVLQWGPACVWCMWVVSHTRPLHPGLFLSPCGQVCPGQELEMITVL